MTTTGGSRKSKKRPKSKKNKVSKGSGQQKQVVNPEVPDTSVDGLDDEPPSERYERPRAKPADQDLRKDGGPKVVDVASPDSSGPSASADSRPADTSGPASESPSPLVAAGSSPKKKETGVMAQEIDNPYTSMIDTSSSQRARETLLEAAAASMRDAAEQQRAADSYRAEAAQLADQGSNFAEVREQMLRRASEADEIASNRRGQASVYEQRARDIVAESASR